MNERNLVVCDSELRYAYGLSENISMRNELAVKVYICTSLESVRRFQQRKPIHILVLDEKFTSEDMAGIGAEQVYVLTSEEGVDFEKEARAIYKFQSADCILAEIFEAYCQEMNETLLRRMKKDRKQLIAVYSPIHRIGRTAFALGLGKELAERGRTLYLNLEGYSDLGGRFQKSEGRSLDDLFYYVRQDSKRAALRLTTMVHQTGELDYISPMVMHMDLQEISFEEWKKLFDCILQESAYETIVLDISECVGNLFQILALCDRIYMPVLEDAVSQRKLEHFQENLRKLKMEDVQSRIHQFVAVENMEEYARKLMKEEA